MAFWDNERTYNELAALTEEMIALAEQQLQITLPVKYIELLQQQNGGALVHTAFPTNEKNNWADDHVNMEEMYGIAENEGILQTAYLIEEWGLPENIVLFAGDGHSWFAFDYRAAKDNPPIIYIEVDDERIIPLAENFEAFVQQLFTYED